MLEVLELSKLVLKLYKNLCLALTFQKEYTEGELLIEMRRQNICFYDISESFFDTVQRLRSIWLKRNV